MPVRTLALLATSLALVACGSQPHPLEIQVGLETPQSAPSWVASPGLDARTEEAMTSAAGVWGRPLDTQGVTVRFLDGYVDCGGRLSVGCTDGGTRTVEVVVDRAACVEATALAHEVGHLLIGDPTHQDERWRDAAFWGRMRSALAAEVPAAETACLSELGLGPVGGSGT
jgi:hypothetical protein